MPTAGDAQDRRSLARLALPVVISFTTRFLFQLIDIPYAMTLENRDAAVAAIAYYLPYQAVHIAVWAGMSAGFTAALSRAIGQRDGARVEALQRAMLRILLAVVPLLSVAGWAITLAIPGFGLEPDLEQAFTIYGGILLVWHPWTSFWSVWPDSVVKSHYDTRTTMVAGLATAAGNAALNTLFVFGFGMGLTGIALATVLSRLFGLGWATRRALAHERARRAAAWPPVELAHRLRPAPAILLLGIPSAATHLLTSVEGLWINRVLTGLPDSTTVIAAYGIYHQMLTLALMPTIGTSLAVLPFVARALPEGLHEHARGELRRIFGLLAISSLALTILLGWVAGRPIARLLVPEEAADPAATEALAVAAFRLLPLGSLAAFPFLLLRPVFEASGHPRRGIGIATLRFVLVCTGVLAGVTLGPRLGTSGLVGTIAGVIAGTAAASAVTRALAYRLLR